MPHLKIGNAGEVGIVLEKEECECWSSGVLQWAGDAGGFCREMGRVKRKKYLRLYLHWLSLTHPRFLSCSPGSSPPSSTHGCTLSILPHTSQICLTSFYNMYTCEVFVVTSSFSCIFYLWS